MYKLLTCTVVFLFFSFSVHSKDQMSPSDVAEDLKDRVRRAPVQTCKNIEAYPIALKKRRFKKRDEILELEACAKGLNADINKRHPNEMIFRYRGSVKEVIAEATLTEEAVVVMKEGHEYEGLVTKERGHYYYYTPDEVFGSLVLPDQFSCNGENDNKFQCLVCSCFFEARGQTKEEQVLVTRTKYSRVLSPAHPNSVCDVVHEMDEKKKIAQYSWRHEKVRPPQGSGLKPKMKKDVVLGEASKERELYFPGSANGYRSCVSAVQESRKHEEEFFAAYYVLKTQKTPRWLKECKRRWGAGETKVSGWENKVEEEDYAHNFYRICEQKEKGLLRTSAAPNSAPRPLKRPKGRSLDY